MSDDHLESGQDHPPDEPQPRSVTPRDPDIAWRPMPGKSGLTFLTLKNPKLCLHSTETSFGWGGDQDGPGPQYPYPPHFTVDYGPDGTWRKRWQHVDTRYGSYALKSGSSCGSANYQLGAVYQIEHVGWAGQLENYPDEWYRAVAEEVVYHHEHLGVPLVYPDDWSSAGRMTCDEFKDFSGVVGHVHAPSPNTHWDAPFDIPRLRDYVDELLEEDGLAHLTDEAQQWLQEMYDSLKTDPDRPNTGDKNPPGPKLFSYLTSFHRWATKKTGFEGTEYDRIVARFNDKS